MPHPPQTMGVAVSGGSDSMALLHLLSEFCAIHDIKLRAVTVDHRLREASTEEADSVARHCAKIGVPHDTLVWQDWDGEGNLQNAAREARYSKMAAWASSNGIDTIAVGHTADDQAETVLMRIARRSGVDGLSAMRPRTVREGITWVRPLLQTKRQTLKTYLTNQDITWVSDPSNEDERYDRIRARKALDLLAPLGIDVDALGEVAKHMAQARKALDWHTFLAAKQIVQIKDGALLIEETGLRLQPDEVQRRLMVKCINWVSGARYAPRSSAIESLLSGVRKGKAGTLDGCHIRCIGDNIWVFREFNAVRNVACATDQLWDNRWKMVSQHPTVHHHDLRIKALGLEGLEQCPDWRATGLPHVMLQSTPAIWFGDSLIAAPHAGFPQNWRAELNELPDTLFAALLSH